MWFLFKPSLSESAVNKIFWIRLVCCIRKFFPKFICALEQERVRESTTKKFSVLVIFWKHFFLDFLWLIKKLPKLFLSLSSEARFPIRQNQNLFLGSFSLFLLPMFPLTFRTLLSTSSHILLGVSYFCSFTTKACIIPWIGSNSFASYIYEGIWHETEHLKCPGYNLGQSSATAVHLDASLLSHVMLWI